MGTREGGTGPVLHYFCVVLNQLSTFRKDPGRNLLACLYQFLAGLHRSHFLFSHVLLQLVPGFKGHFWFLLHSLEELPEMDICVSAVSLCILLLFFAGFMLMSVCD